MTLSHARIVGSGLIGTSIGLALRRSGVNVSMEDKQPSAAQLAQDLMGCPPSDHEADIVILASPISTISKVIRGLSSSNLNTTFMDISSVKNKVKVEVLASDFPIERFVLTHPMAGREVGGASSARGDLFQGRAWIYEPDGVNAHSLSLALEVIQMCGASAVPLSTTEHDEAVALISHLPQILSSILAGNLEGAKPQWLDLAGGGLRDTTRIAASDPLLWREILSSNSGALEPLLRKVAGELNELADGLEDPSVSQKVMERGNRGRAAIPGKHGGVARNYTYLPVVIEDKAGQLAALFEECALAQVNVEDLTIEHSPEQFTGLITLALSQSDAEKLFNHLLEKNWKVHDPRN